jgi:hypothetical protein
VLVEDKSQSGIVFHSEIVFAALDHDPVVGQYR